ncbi:MAG: DUF2235 domain-containing protein [bacterium]|nr:DUF2235 domain-containing protein [Gammaproteobacteria bacterium]HIL98964.1 DUF2235 domain-containing protein [Pseudomonadales bacterium]
MKRIVICADGTWNKPDQTDRGKRKPSNVVKTARGVLPRDNDGVAQIAYYNDGVGTNWGLDKIAGGGLGVGLSANIVDAYQFLVLNYEPGDDIFLFGFSWGAYTVRSLAGLLDSIGILPKGHAFYIPDGYTLYRDKSSQENIDKFRQEHGCREGPVKYVGVWDTVGALGVPVGLFKSFNKKYQFHQVGLSDNIENAYHALAIDERRRPFTPTLWSLPQDSKQMLDQTWFAGVHTNIGGGYSKDGLANIPLHWLKEKATSHGLEFDETFLVHYKPWFGHELRDSMTWVYRLLIPKSRVIGMMKNGNESIHKSVYQRMDKDPDYKPKSLLKYLKRYPREVEDG